MYDISVTKTDSARKWRFAYTDRRENYLSFHGASPHMTDGFVSAEAVLLYDIGIMHNGTAVSRFKNCRTAIYPHGVSFSFSVNRSTKKRPKETQQIRADMSLLYEPFSLYAAAQWPSVNRTEEQNPHTNALYVLFAPQDAKRIQSLSIRDSVSADAIAADAAAPDTSSSYLYRFEDSTGIAAAVSSVQPFSVRLPSAKEYAKLKAIYGKNAAGAVCLEQTEGADKNEWYITFDYQGSPESYTDRALRLAETGAVKKHRETVDAFTDSIRFSVNGSSAQTGPLMMKALRWAAFSGWNLVTGAHDRGIWAGLPWFRDNWGRDTFIALSGILLAAGCFDEAKSVIKSFARYQELDPESPDYGRIPNRYRGGGNVIFNTADGTLWFIREIWEYAQYTGDRNFIIEQFAVIKTAIDADLAKRTDDALFLLHGDADTWMDARLEGNLPFSPRGDKAIDIQALWYTALCIGVKCAHFAGDENSAERWQKAAVTLKQSIRSYFWNETESKAADCILPDTQKIKNGNGRSMNPNFSFVPESRHFDPAAFECDYAVRPNQLFTIQAPDAADEQIFDDTTEAYIIQNCTDELVLPYGITSLSPKDPYFHPYHDGCSAYHKDAAYHNGTIWGWNAGALITALCRHGQQDFAWQLKKELARQILEEGCIGSMSENLNAVPDADGSITCSGTWSQAWSVSEFVRNTYQDYVGFKPRMLDKTVQFSPRLPREWKTGSAECAIEDRSLTDSPCAGRFIIEWNLEEESAVYTISHTFTETLRIRFDTAVQKTVAGCQFDLPADTRRTIQCDAESGGIRIDGRQVQTQCIRNLFLREQDMHFASCAEPGRYDSVRTKNYLAKKLTAGAYNVQR